MYYYEDKKVWFGISVGVLFEVENCLLLKTGFFNQTHQILPVYQKCEWANN